MTGGRYILDYLDTYILYMRMFNLMKENNIDYIKKFVKILHNMTQF